jgi:hypothetical protein
MEMADWKVKGTVLVACNCDYGCPCNFNAPPTTGDCEGSWTWHIEQGSYGDVSLDGLTLGVYADWPGAIHEGGGKAVVYYDERADDSQREALETLVRGEAGGPWGIFINTYELVGVHPAPFELEFAEERSRLKVGDAVELQMEPIKNPVTGAETRAAVVLPRGLVFNEGWCATSTHFSVRGDVEYDHSGKNTEYAAFEYAGP